MIVDSIRFRGHECFQKHWAGFDQVKPINVIIGRNNSGKSRLLDLVEVLCLDRLAGRGWTFQFSGVLEEAELRKGFERFGSPDWINCGKLHIGRRGTWIIDNEGVPRDIEVAGEPVAVSQHPRTSPEIRLSALLDAVSGARHRLAGSVFCRLFADRDIRPEPPDSHLVLGSDGTGATNIIRRYLVTSHREYPPEVVQVELLTALNRVFGKDGQFTGIEVKHHDEDASGSLRGKWEVYLGERCKGLVPLSRSGSGLKTVILVLLNLLVVPVMQKKEKSKFTFAFEELENNLHPALLRRLLQFLEKYAIEEAATIFLTTHSSTALDLFGLSDNSQIIHVTHDGDSAETSKVSAHFGKLQVISELGAKPSDLLQANGILWVEGPSDRTYLTHWIEIFSEGALKEGRDYQCAFYGGSLLARTQFVSPDTAGDELVNLIKINHKSRRGL
jgi:predicted ATPase